MECLKNPSWLNENFVEEILRNSEKDNAIKVKNFFSSIATNKGDNYTSDVIRVTIEFFRGNRNAHVAEKKTVIIKIAADRGVRKDLTEHARTFDVEMLMMTSILPKMNQLLKNNLSSRILHVQKSNPTLIVMEDLGAFGFCKPNRQLSLDLAHSLVIMRRIAQFHASSVALCEKDPKIKEGLSKGLFSDDYTPELMNFYVRGMREFVQFVTKWPRLGSKYGEKIQKFADQAYELCVKATKCRKDSFNVINHGDFTINNILFSYPRDDLIEHMFVDFQFCMFTSPAVDLNMFLSTSVKEEVLRNNKQKLLEEYLCTLTDIMKQLHCKTTPPNMAQLRQELRDRVAIEMIGSFVVLPILLADHEDIKSLDEIMKIDGVSENPIYKSEVYRDIIVERVQRYKEMGLLDLD